MNSILKDPYVHWKRKIMRLCAMGMVSDNKLDACEREAIVEIILRDLKKAAKTSFPECSAGLFAKNKKGFAKKNKEAKALSSDDEKIFVDTEVFRKVCERVLSCDTKDPAVSEGQYEIKSIPKAIKDESGKDKRIIEEESARKIAASYVTVVQNQLAGDEHKMDASRGLFVDIGTLGDEEALRELRDMVYVIKADNIVAEKERMAFIAVSKVYKFSGVDHMWNEFFDMPKDRLLGEECIKRDLYDERRIPISVEDVKLVEKAIVDYGVDGPLRYGLESAIQRDKYDLVKHRERSRKRLSKWALLVFALSALIVYFECAIHLETKFIEIESQDVIKVDHPIVESIKALGSAGNNSKSDGLVLEEGIGKILPDGYENAFRVFLGICLLLALWGLYHWYSRSLFKDKLIWVKVWKNWACRFILKALMVLVLLGVFFIGILTTWFSFEDSVFDVFLSISWAPFWVLCMMLSIEIMVFMREKYTKESDDEREETSSALLIIFVVAAVVADLCIGFIELPADFTPLMVLNKVAYSIFLGCLSFFAGKFMEMDAIQKRVEEKRIDESINNIKAYLED